MHCEIGRQKALIRKISSRAGR